MNQNCGTANHSDLKAFEKRELFFMYSHFVAWNNLCCVLYFSFSVSVENLGRSLLLASSFFPSKFLNCFSTSRISRAFTLNIDLSKFKSDYQQYWTPQSSFGFSFQKKNQKIPKYCLYEYRGFTKESRICFEVVS